jgi:serine/threonine protein kinase
VMHRDLKASNILMTRNGVIKIADFGLGRRVSKGGNYTNKVITRWYRPPELLLGVMDYNVSIDVWSIGCILGELLMQKAIFPGEDDLHQVELIFSLCGTPTVRTWPGIERIERFNTMQLKNTYARQVIDKFRKAPNATPSAVDLLDKFLDCCPATRISLEDALKHEWFSKKPLPQFPQNLPVLGCNELTAKKRRKQERDSGVRLNVTPPSKKIKYEEKTERESHYRVEEKRPPESRSYDDRRKSFQNQDRREYDRDDRRDSRSYDRRDSNYDRRDSRGIDNRQHDRKHDDHSQGSGSQKN